MDKAEMRDVAETLVGNGITNMTDETGDFNANMQLINDGFKMWKQLEDVEPDEEELRRKKLQNKILEEELKEKEQKNAEHLLDRDHELYMKNLEKQEKELEKDAKIYELVNRKKSEAWDRGLKIAGIAAPIVGALVTTVAGIVIFKKKSDMVNSTLKLNTLLQEKGYMSGLTNGKIVDSQFNQLLK